MVRIEAGKKFELKNPVKDIVKPFEDVLNAMKAIEANTPHYVLVFNHTKRCTVDVSFTDGGQMVIMVQNPDDERFDLNEK